MAEDPQEERMLTELIREAGDPVVEPAEPHRAAVLQSMRTKIAGVAAAAGHGGLTSGSRSSGWRVARLVSAGIAAMVFVGAFLWRSRPAEAWPQIVEALQATSWVRATEKTAKEETELWVSAEQGIMASRCGQSVQFVDHRRNINQVYDPETSILYSMPVHDEQLSEPGALGALFLALLSDHSDFQLTAVASRLVPQSECAFQGDKHGATEYCFRFKDTRVCEGKTFEMVFQVDPKTRVPYSWTVRMPGEQPNSLIVRKYVLDFPQQGPTDVHALGVPEGCERVRGDGDR